MNPITMERIGKMEYYEPHWYSAEGADYKKQLEELQALTPSLNKKVADQESKYNLSLNTFNTWRSSALECKRLRDEKSSGIGKNNACDINELDRRNRMWSAWEKAKDDDFRTLTTYKKTLSDHLGTIDKVTKQAIESTKADPKLQIELKNIEAKNKTEREAIAAKAKTERDALKTQGELSLKQSEMSSKNKKLLITGLIVIAVAGIGYAIFKVVKK